MPGAARNPNEHRITYSISKILYFGAKSEKQLNKLAVICVTSVILIASSILSLSFAYSSSGFASPTVGCFYKNGDEYCTTLFKATCGTTETPIPGATIYPGIRGIRITTNSKGVAKFTVFDQHYTKLPYTIRYPPSYGGGSYSGDYTFGTRVLNHKPAC
jgi:hypothetical protein